MFFHLCFKRRKVLKLPSLCDYVCQSLVLSSQSWSSDDDYLFGFPAWVIVATHPLSLSSHTHAPHTGHPLIHLVMRMRIVNIFVQDDDIWLKVLIMPVWLNAPTLESRSGLADDITQTFLTHVISLSADTSKHPPTHPPTHTNLIWLPTSFHWWCTTEFFSLCDCFCLEHLDLGSEMIINHVMIKFN